jgi:hypothetical protein
LPEVRNTYSIGAGLMWPLIDATENAGVEILLEHKMTAIHRESPLSGRVTGISVEHRGATRTIRARKAVIIGTGGSAGNVNFRRMFDPRLTEEYCGLAGMPWSDQDASGEIAGMAVGAALWGLANQTAEFGFTLTKNGRSASFPVDLFLPVAQENFPLVVALDFRLDEEKNYCPIEEIMEHQVAVARVLYTNISSDDGDFENHVLDPNS